MNLLAHRTDGTRAIIQHDDGHPYDYRFGEVDTYTRIQDTARTVDPVNWVTDYPIGGNHFDTINQVKLYLFGFVGGLEGDDE